MININDASFSTVIASIILIMFFITNFYLYNAFKKIEKIPQIEIKLANALMQLSQVLIEVKAVLNKNQEIVSKIEVHEERIKVNRESIHELRIDLNNLKE